MHACNTRAQRAGWSGSGSGRARHSRLRALRAKIQVAQHAQHRHTDHRGPAFFQASLKAFWHSFAVLSSVVVIAGAFVGATAAKLAWETNKNNPGRCLQWARRFGCANGVAQALPEWGCTPQWPGRHCGCQNACSYAPRQPLTQPAAPSLDTPWSAEPYVNTLVVPSSASQRMATWSVPETSCLAWKSNAVACAVRGSSASIGAPAKKKGGGLAPRARRAL